jgi:hypothetical protein
MIISALKCKLLPPCLPIPCLCIIRETSLQTPTSLDQFNQYQRTLTSIEKGGVVDQILTRTGLFSGVNIAQGPLSSLVCLSISRQITICAL